MVRNALNDLSAGCSAIVVHYLVRHHAQVVLSQTCPRLRGLDAVVNVIQNTASNSRKRPTGQASRRFSCATADRLGWDDGLSMTCMFEP